MGEIGERVSAVTLLSGLLLASFAATQFAATSAQAWGLSTDLNIGWLNSQLVTRVLKSHEIDYCVQLEDPRFSQGTIERQVAAVLPIWLKPLEDLGIQDTAIRAVDCASNRFDLKVEIGPENNFKTLGSYQLPQSENGHSYSLVKVDSNYVYVGKNADYSIVDFETFVPAGKSLASVMNYISWAHPATPESFAAYAGVDYDAVFWSTYRIFIHEIGHSFGLCDTYPSQIQVHCDPNFMSKDQPSSVMYDSDYFYLTDDDVAGIRALFKRYLK